MITIIINKGLALLHCKLYNSILEGIGRRLGDLNLRKFRRDKTFINVTNDKTWTKRCRAD